MAQVRWSPRDLQEVLTRPGVRLTGANEPRPPPPPVLRHRSCAPYRSHLEARYAAYLDTLIQQGSLTRWRYEAVRLTLAPRTTLTVDFLLTDGETVVALDEVKGGWARDDAMVKLKVAATLYPEWLFRLVTWDTATRVWAYKVIPRH